MGRGKHLTFQEKIHILELASKGYSQTAIAQEVGRSQPAVFCVLNRWKNDSDIKPKPRRRKPRKLNEAEISELVSVFASCGESFSTEITNNWNRTHKKSLSVRTVQRMRKQFNKMNEVDQQHAEEFFLNEPESVPPSPSPVYYDTASSVGESIGESVGENQNSFFREDFASLDSGSEKEKLYDIGSMESLPSSFESNGECFENFMSSYQESGKFDFDDEICQNLFCENPMAVEEPIISNFGSMPNNSFEDPFVHGFFDE